MARPIAASAAATVNIKRAKIWPVIFCKQTEKATRLTFTESKINSIDIKIISKLRLFKTKPKTPSKKIIVVVIIKKFRDKYIDFFQWN